MTIAGDLHDLQQIDSAIDAAKASLATIEEQLGESEELTAGRQAVEERRGALEDLRRRQRDLEWQVDDLRSRLSKVESKLYGGAVPNPRELAGLKEEADVFGGQIRRLEKDLMAAGMELDRWLTEPIVVLGFRLHPRGLLDNLEGAASNALGVLPGGSLNILSDVTTNLLWGLVVLVSLYYFLKDGPKIKPWLVGLAPVEDRGEIHSLLDEIDSAWALFLKVQLLIFVVLAVLLAIGTFLVIWLFRAGLLPVSPLGLVLLLVLVYVLVQQVDNLWLRPRLMGRKLYLHPGLVFVGLMGALALSGVLGAIIVVPLMATAKIIAGYVHRRLLGLPLWPQADGTGPEHEDQREGTSKAGHSEPASPAAPATDLPKEAKRQP
jgi:hypothetical protein